ncbi:hypothetical protein RI367_002377 [Sorochytrium milnesiophthora]
MDISRAGELDPDADDHGNTCRALSYFEEAEECKAEVAKVLHADEKGDHQAMWRVTLILQKYQEQPQLLDPHLEALLKPVIHFIRDNVISGSINGSTGKLNARDHQLFGFLYLVSKTRGPKIVVRFFTHEAADLEPVLQFLAQQDPAAHGKWEARYISLLWLSLIVMTPFDMARIDSGQAGDKTLVQRLIDTARSFLGLPAKDRDGAATLLARLLTRRDVMAAHLPDFISWAAREFKGKPNVFLRSGIFSTLAQLYQMGQRETLLSTVDTVSELCQFAANDQQVARNSLLRKMLSKVVQRVALVRLKQRVASWRYQRGSRSIEANMKLSSARPAAADSGLQLSKQVDEAPTDDAEEVSQHVEEAVALLLESLRDTDTIVRWSAAKGLGRIADRLPADFASEVVSAILTIFPEGTFPSTQPPLFAADASEPALELSAVSDSAWHGACLALAEFARRGLLLPDRLPDVIHWIEKALTFDVRRGSHSVGAHVRDAACYVCWSFARAYAPEVMMPHVSFLAPSLVTASVYDREINVRRAASAAFQENVGRQGIFSHGIDIVTTADFFAVGNRTNSFLTVGMEIAQFAEYRRPMIEFLIMRSYNHWDKAVRELAATAIGQLAPLEPQYFNDVLRYLVPHAMSSDLPTRHGALMTIGEIIAVLDQHSSFTVDEQLQASRSARILDIPHSYPEPFLRDFGSETTLEAMSKFIGCLAKTKFGRDGSDAQRHFDRWLALLTLCLERREVSLQEAAARSVGVVLAARPPADHNVLVRSWLRHLLPHAEPFAKRGYALALGQIDYSVDDELFRTALVGLMAATAVQEKQYNDAEAKRNAMLSIGALLERHKKRLTELLPSDMYTRLIECMLRGIQDYSIDQRGDVGSWLRQASMTALVITVTVAVEAGETVRSQYLPLTVYIRIVAAVLQQSVEKIDRVRQVAGTALPQLLAFDHMVSQAHLEPLRKVITETHIDWLFPSSVFATFIPLMHIPSMRQSLLSGIAISIGGLTESLVKPASTALTDFLGTLPAAHDSELSLNQVGATIVDIMRAHERDDRVIIAVLEMLDVVYSAEVMYKLTDQTVHEHIYQQCRLEVAKSRDPRKLLAGAKILVALSGTQTARQPAMQSLLTMLVHTMPRIRHSTAELLFGSLHVYLDAQEAGGAPIDEDAVAQAEQVLAEVDCPLMFVQDLAAGRVRASPLSASPAHSATGRKTLVAVSLTADNAKKLRSFVTSNAVDVWSEVMVVGRDIHLLLTEPQLASFKSLQEPFTVSMEDVGAFVQQSDQAPLSASFGPDGQGLASSSARNGTAGEANPASIRTQYQTMDQLYQLSYRLQSVYPGQVDVNVIGKSYENRDILAVHIHRATGSNSTSRRALLVLSGAVTINMMHALLDNSTTPLPGIQRMRNEFDVYFVPLVNPDGYVYTFTDDRLWRKNRQPNAGSRCIGTDLNRNFPAQWGFKTDDFNRLSDPCDETYHGPSESSAPETQVLLKWATALQANGTNLVGMYDFHSFSQLWMYPYGHSCTEHAKDEAILKAASQVAVNAIHNATGLDFVFGQICNTIYPASGSATDWLYTSQNVTFAFAVELRPTGPSPGFVLPPDQIEPAYNETMAAFLATGDYIASYYNNQSMWAGQDPKAATSSPSPSSAPAPQHASWAITAQAALYTLTSLMFLV